MSVLRRSVEVLHNHTHGTPPACNTSDYPVVGTVQCDTGPAQAAAALRPLPEGQRSIQWLTMYIPRAVHGRWEDHGELALWDLDSTGSIMPFAGDKM